LLPNLKKMATMNREIVEYIRIGRLLNIARMILSNISRLMLWIRGGYG